MVAVQVRQGGRCGSPHRHHRTAKGVVAGRHLRCASDETSSAPKARPEPAEGLLAHHLPATLLSLAICPIVLSPQSRSSTTSALGIVKSFLILVFHPT